MTRAGSDDKTATITSVSAHFKDLYALPGTILKQWVVDFRREQDWEDATCPRVEFDTHEHIDDYDGRPFPFDGPRKFLILDDEDCDACAALYRKALERDDVKAWLVERAARPPICQDLNKLSDQVAPEWPAMGDHPFLAMLPKGRR